MYRFLGVLACALALGANASTNDDIRGFSASGSAQERELESRARAIPDPAQISAYMRRMSLKPHLAGTPASKAVAEYILGQMKEWGLDAHIEQYEALLPTPRSRELEMVAPQRFRAKLEEPPVAEDPSSFDGDEVPTYNAYSGSADVTAPLVYANYGMPADYEYLAKNGIEVKGKIVLTRYGGGWRGLKPKLAAQHGAAGCLIYSDPHDDGYFKGDVFPAGPWRPADGVQRGSVADMTLYPGDPLSPGWASEPGSRRLKLEEAVTIMKIPVLPISYGDALPLLRFIGGAVAPENWRGALGITYHVGDGHEQVHLKIDMDNGTHPLYDVIARIPGAELPDEWVLAGNHHDAWVHGAMDPLSGASALLETARTLAMMTRSGWRPKRTVMIALWDGEEFGLIGSTEFAEKHADELSKKLAVYINSDTSGSGHLSAGGSHTLEQFVTEVARDVTDPASGKPLEATMRAGHRARDNQVRDNPGGTPATPEPQPWHLEALGSGSDYTSFLQHLGIASLNIGFEDEVGDGGVYHSAYDSYYWYSHFSDPKFEYEKTLSQVSATALMRLADAPLLPFEFTRFEGAVTRYISEIERIEKQKTQKNSLDLGAVKTELQTLERSAQAYEQTSGKAMAKLDGAAAARLAAVNDDLIQTERKMLLSGGLPRRNWFQHGIYAPGALTGYGVKTLPGIREAIEAGDVTEARREASRVVEVLRAVDAQIQSATRALDGL